MHRTEYCNFQSYFPYSRCCGGRMENIDRFFDKFSYDIPPFYAEFIIFLSKVGFVFKDVESIDKFIFLSEIFDYCYYPNDFNNEYRNILKRIVSFLEVNVFFVTRVSFWEEEVYKTDKFVDFFKSLYQLIGDIDGDVRYMRNFLRILEKFSLSRTIYHYMVSVFRKDAFNKSSYILRRVLKHSEYEVLFLFFIMEYPNFSLRRFKTFIETYERIPGDNFFSKYVFLLKKVISRHFFSESYKIGGKDLELYLEMVDHIKYIREFMKKSNICVEYDIDTYFMDMMSYCLYDNCSIYYIRILYSYINGKKCDLDVLSTNLNSFSEYFPLIMSPISSCRHYFFFNKYEISALGRLYNRDICNSKKFIIEDNNYFPGIFNSVFINNMNKKGYDKFLRVKNISEFINALLGDVECDNKVLLLKIENIIRKIVYICMYIGEMEYCFSIVDKFSIFYNFCGRELDNLNNWLDHILKYILNIYSYETNDKAILYFKDSLFLFLERIEDVRFLIRKGVSVFFVLNVFRDDFYRDQIKDLQFLENMDIKLESFRECFIPNIIKLFIDGRLDRFKSNREPDLFLLGNKFAIVMNMILPSGGSHYISEYNTLIDAIYNSLSRQALSLDVRDFVQKFLKLTSFSVERTLGFIKFLICFVDRAGSVCFRKNEEDISIKFRIIEDILNNFEVYYKKLFKSLKNKEKDNILDIKKLVDSNFDDLLFSFENGREEFIKKIRFFFAVSDL